MKRVQEEICNLKILVSQSSEIKSCERNNPKIIANFGNAISDISKIIDEPSVIVSKISNKKDASKMISEFKDDDNDVDHKNSRQSSLVE